MQSETAFPSSHQLKSYVASKSRLKLPVRAVLSADAGLLVSFIEQFLKTKKRHMLSIERNVSDNSSTQIQGEFCSCK